jgi:hypothetical protein
MIMHGMKAVKALALAAFVFAGVGVFGQTTAVVRELTGTVEIKVPGGTGWEPARQGQGMSGDTLISTGFKSFAVIELGNSTLMVHPLTRLSITELFLEGKNDKVRLELRAGRIRAEVKPPAGGGLSFSVRSPIATASVRGTVFELDTVNVSVSEGTVEFAGASGAPVLVDSGGATYVEGATGRPVSPAETAAAELRPASPAGTEAALPAAVSGAAPETAGESPLDVSVSF